MSAVWPLTSTLKRVLPLKCLPRVNRKLGRNYTVNLQSRVLMLQPQFGRLLTVYQRALFVVATSQYHLLEKRKRTWTIERLIGKQ